MKTIKTSSQLIERLGSSEYLRSLMGQEYRLVPSIGSESISAMQMRKQLHFIIDRFATVSENTIDLTAQDFLRQQKRQFSLLWSIANLADCFDYQELGAWWTLFADGSIDFALRAAWRLPEIKRLCTSLSNDLTETVPGLFVLGLGKLGGNDLNFSSDIDLVAFYDADLVPVSPMQGKTDVCTRVLKQMTQLLSEVTNQGFVWRVDWRLRPEASVNPLAMPVSAGVQFYYFRALPWHRLAMMKARVVAGDQQTGRLFLSELDSFIWRINLDYRSLDEIGELKQKINLEHPALRLARDQNHEITADCADFNIKLGRGGIREIEFIVNAMQLIWGGRRIALRIPNTVDALKQLSEENLLDTAVAQQLKSAYCMFRRVENAIQMLDNQQQYQLPTTEDRQQALLQLLNQNVWQQLTEALYQHRKFVAKEFDACFADNEKQRQTVSGSYSLLDETLQPAATEILNGWLNGFQIYGVVNTETDQMTALFDYLTDELHASGLPADDAIVRVDAFFRSMPVGTQYFRLLQAHPALLKSIIRPLLISSPMATLLEQSPHIVDALISPAEQEHQFNPQRRSNFVLASARAEVRAERLRRFVNEELYIAYLGLLQGKISTTQLHQQLTSIAEHSLDLGLTITCEYMELEESPIAVLGLGKLGMESMSPLSDLDLIFIAKSIDEIEPANRFARRFQHLMETRMKEGIAYEMDMRLRPSGRSGPPTVSLDSFEKYHRNRAQTWEHIALIPGRFVSGNSVIGAQANKIRQQLFAQPRDRQQFINDAWKMLSRIRDQRTTEVAADSLSIKLRRGGLMEADYLTACIAIHEIPQRLDWAALKYAQLLKEIANNTRYSELDKVVNFWRHLQVWVRLLNLEAVTVSHFPAQELSCLLNDLGLKNELQLREKMMFCAKTIDGYLDQFMQERSVETSQQVDDWEETAVIWL